MLNVTWSWSEIQDLRAAAKFYFDAYRKCVDDVIDPGWKKYGALHIPAYVNLILSIELILKLFVHTDNYLEDKIWYKYNKIRKTIKTHDPELIIMCIKNKWLIALLNKDDNRKQIIDALNKFQEIRYFFDGPVTISDWSVLKSFFEEAYWIIWSIHKWSKDKFLFSYSV